MHNKIVLSLVLIFLFAAYAITINSPGLFAQEVSEDKLISKEIEQEGAQLDKQILAVNRDLMNVFKDYKLSSDDMKKNIRIIPYQTTIKYADNGKGNYLEVSRHKFIRNPLNLHKTIGIKNKTFRLYYTGETINKIELEIFERYYEDNSAIRVNISEPSPGDEQTGDITFTHTLLVNYTIENAKYRRDVKLLDNKKLAEILNTTAFPIRNSIKRDVLIPNLVFVNNVLLDIAETHNKGKKDAETLMLEFLKKSVDY